MPIGKSIHIGVVDVDPAHYGQNFPRLTGPVNDATRMRDIAVRCGFQPVLLVNDQATTKAVSDEIRLAASTLGSGDMLLITYSGHGGQVPNPGPGDDSLDETWCLFDRQLIDDELYALWRRFAAGVRILVISDSCHSGTVAGLMPSPLVPLGAEKGLTPPEAKRVYADNKLDYDAIQNGVPQGRCGPIKASIISFAACQDCETALDGNPHAEFTQALLDVWADGAFDGNHLTFFEKIFGKVSAIQRPNYLRLGTPNAAFDLQRPFTI